MPYKYSGGMVTLTTIPLEDFYETLSYTKLVLALARSDG
ncbi:hypothetical protein ANCDUO_25451 [Ancylostoma duodenale]|uniref:Uncharacterized protein n=1 Tax=Ancylostoma duodenale TaxID=51022 RepID=A0A0C2BL72_9BILA|nr:hypothetical protein ANCDUO_25451 [Ancylostoma duodenale]